MTRTIAVFLGGDLQSGGGYQYEMSIVDLLQKFGQAYRFVYFVDMPEKAAYLQNQGLTAASYRYGILQKLELFAYEKIIFHRLLHRLGLGMSSIERLLKQHGADLVYFLAPTRMCASFSQHHYVLTLWDLCHRDYLEFPEVGFSKEFESREQMYTQILKKAVAVIVDSMLGKANVERRYGVDPSRIHDLGFLPGLSSRAIESDIDIHAKYAVSGDYIYYPAQFWAHKNHVYIIDALKLLKERNGILITALFSGSNKGNLTYVLDYASACGVRDQIKYIGFVDSEEIPLLYRQALALVMPTYFGPTNIPPLEAFSLGCPVCYSDLPGLRDQVGDAGFLMDLSEPASLADHLLSIRSNPALVDEKKTRGKAILSRWSDKDFWNRLDGIFRDFFRLRRCWGD